MIARAREDSSQGVAGWSANRQPAAKRKLARILARARGEEPLEEDDTQDLAAD